MTVTKDILKAPDLQETTNQLANCLPEGRAWNNKRLLDSNYYYLIESISAQLNEIQQKIEEVATEMFVQTTDSLMPEFLKDSGLPDNCIQEFGDLESQREKVLQRLNKLPLLTKEQIEQLIFDITGYIITITAGSKYSTFPLPFPIRFGNLGGSVVIDVCGSNDIDSITSSQITPVTITGVTRTDTTATVTHTSHTLYENMKVLISGSSISDYDGIREVLEVISDTQFTFDIVGNPTTPSAGGQFVYTEANVTTSQIHTLNVEDKVRIYGANELPYNGMFIINTSVDNTHFTYTFIDTPISPATGTLFYKTLCCVNLLPYLLPIKFYTDRCNLIGCILREVLPAKTTIIFI